MSGVGDGDFEVIEEIEEQKGQNFAGVWSQAKAFTAGGVGGVAAVLTGHPFDLMKVRQQTGNLSLASAARQVLQHDGPRGFYRGVGAPLLGVTPMFAVSFWGYDVGQKVVRSMTKTEGPLSISEVSTAGFISAIPTTLITAPFERIKVVLQLQGQSKLGENAKELNGSIDAAKHILRTGGLKSLFKGSIVTLARDGPGSALYFAAYEYIKRRGMDEKGNIDLKTIVFAGGMAGVAMWVPVFPIDSIKTNLQSSDTPQSIAEVTRKIYARAGLKGFFPGVGSALARSFPANAATFLGVELAHKAFTALNL